LQKTEHNVSTGITRGSDPPFGSDLDAREVSMRTSFAVSTLTAALLLALALPAESGGGAYFGGGGGGGGRGMSGGGFGGGMGRGVGAMPTGGSMGGASYGAPRAPAWGGGRGGNGNGNWHGGNGNWHGGNGNWHGHWHGSYWGYGGWYYPYWGWWWPGLTIAATWPYWYGYGYPNYYDPGSWSYGAPSGTIIYRSGPDGAASAPNPTIRLFCPSTNAYYPDVRECGEQWLKVLPPENATPVPPPTQDQPTPQSYTPRYAPPASQTSAQRSPAPATRAASSYWPTAPLPSMQRASPPASAPSGPVNARGYEVTASLDSGYVRTSTRSEIASAARPMTVGYTPAADASVVATHSVPSAVGTKIPAPRMSLPRGSAPVTQVAEIRAD
jgi:hypothetical protein